MIEFFNRLFKPRPSRGGLDRAAYPIYAQCDRCGELLAGTVELRNELSLADDGETYVVRKGLMGSGARRCFQMVEIMLHFDAGKRQVLDSEATGGRLLSEDEYAELLAQQAAEPENEEQASEEE